jgi:hypothetical protein
MSSKPTTTKERENIIKALIWKKSKGMMKFLQKY